MSVLLTLRNPDLDSGGSSGTENEDRDTIVIMKMNLIGLGCLALFRWEKNGTRIIQCWVPLTTRKGQEEGLTF